MGNYNSFYNAFNPQLLGYEYAWVKFVKYGTADASIIRSEVLDSWRRCKAMNLDPLVKESPPIITSVRDRIQKHQPLVNAAWPFMQNLYKLVKGSGFRVDIVDEEGHILKSIGDSDIMKISEKTRSLPGANKSEKIAGTTSVGLALIHKKPFQLSGAEHYLQTLQRWVCSTAPILDETGLTLGALNMAGGIGSAHQHTLGMVAATAKAIENELKLQTKNKLILKNNNQLKATLEAVNDGVVYVDNEGTITQINFQMEKFLDSKAKSIIGKNIENGINTTPSLKSILASSTEVSHFDIIVHGQKKNYNCLLTIKLINNKYNEGFGIVFTFIRTEEIRKMANKISKYSAYYTFDDMIGESKEYKDVIRMAKKASDFNFRVIIEGESGTGKEMFAQAIHNNSSRQSKPFIAVDCGAIPRELLESELFGYEEGAFTGAKRGGHPGKFEVANGGTLFLDEITNMSMQMQAKLLRVLQENQAVRIGGHNQIPIDVRVIAATNKDLKEEVLKNNFREDLFYRLNVFHIKIPPLRHRKDDIPILVDYFFEKNKSMGKGKTVDENVMKLLKNHTWPGNVRQLYNVMERAFIMSTGNKIHKEDLPKDIIRENIATQLEDNTTLISLEENNIRYVKDVLEKTKGNVTKAASILNISRTSIYNILKKENSTFNS